MLQSIIIDIITAVFYFPTIPKFVLQNWNALQRKKMLWRHMAVRQGNHILSYPILQAVRSCN